MGRTCASPAKVAVVVAARSNTVASAVNQRGWHGRFLEVIGFSCFESFIAAFLDQAECLKLLLIVVCFPFFNRTHLSGIFGFLFTPVPKRSSKNVTEILKSFSEVLSYDVGVARF